MSITDDVYTETKMINSYDDATLVTRTINGDDRAFGAIIDRYKDAVFGIALARVRNFHDAEDLTQITFVEAYGRMNHLRASTTLGPWLRTIATNRAINLVNRRRQTIDLQTIEEPASESRSPDTDLDEAETRERVMSAIGRLSKSQRETVTLYYIGEYTVAEVAAIQDIPVGTVKRRLHDGRQRLREDMADMVEDVLKNSAPDSEMADRVYKLLTAYPSGGRFYNRNISATLAESGAGGKEGFARTLSQPHARTRAMAVHYLGWEHGLSEAPAEMAIDLLYDALRDTNRGVRVKAVRALLIGTIPVTPDVYAKRIIPRVMDMLSDNSKRARRSVLFYLSYWAHHVATSNELVCRTMPLEQICKAMVIERDSINISRFQGLIGTVLACSEGDS